MVRQRLSALGNLVTRAESLWSFFTLVMGTGLFAWLGKSWDTLAANGAEAVLMFAILASSVLVGALSLAYIAVAHYLGRSNNKHDRLLETQTGPETVSFGNFGSITFNRLYYDPGANHGKKRAFIDIIVPFLFTRRAELISIQVRAIAHRRWHNMHNPEFLEHQWRPFESELVLPHEKKDILIARISLEEPDRGYYGDLSIPCMDQNEQHGFKITVYSTLGEMSKIALLEIPRAKDGMSIEHTYHGNRFFVVEDGQDAFLELRERLNQSPLTRSV